MSNAYQKTGIIDTVPLHKYGLRQFNPVWKIRRYSIVERNKKLPLIYLGHPDAVFTPPGQIF